MENIEFDYGKAVLAEQQLQDVHKKINRFINENMEHVIEEVGYGWQNEEGRYFMTKLQALRKKLQNTSLQIQKAEDSVTQAIQTAVRVEEQVKEIACIRK